MRRSRSRMRGYSITEVLTVLVILTIMVLIATPLVSKAVRVAKVRTVASQLAMDLRAARLIAVSNRKDVAVTIKIEADGNYYEYEDAHGRIREIEMPSGVRIVSSTDPITFRSNGSVLGISTTVLEADLSNTRASQWTVTTTPLGITRTENERIDK